MIANPESNLYVTFERSLHRNLSHCSIQDLVQINHYKPRIAEAWYKRKGTCIECLIYQSTIIILNKKKVIFNQKIIKIKESHWSLQDTIVMNFLQESWQESCVFHDILNHKLYLIMLFTKYCPKPSFDVVSVFYDIKLTCTSQHWSDSLITFWVYCYSRSTTFTSAVT